jgi:hypothetical protein
MHPNTPQEICDSLETTQLSSGDSLSVTPVWGSFFCGPGAFFLFEDLLNTRCYCASHASTEQNPACSAGFREPSAQSFECTFSTAQCDREWSRTHD